MLRDLGHLGLSLGTESIWLPRALQSARTLRGGERKEGEEKEAEEGARGSGSGASEGTHLQSLSALPPGGAGPLRCTFLSTRTLCSCSRTVVTSPSCFRGDGRRKTGEKIKKELTRAAFFMSCFVP